MHLQFTFPVFDSKKRLKMQQWEQMYTDQSLFIAQY